MQGMAMPLRLSRNLVSVAVAIWPIRWGSSVNLESRSGHRAYRPRWKALKTLYLTGNAAASVGGSQVLPLVKFDSVTPTCYTGWRGKQSRIS